MTQRSLFTDTRTSVANIRLHEYDVYVGRPRGATDPIQIAIGREGWLGNPYDIRKYPDALERFRQYFTTRVETDPAFRSAVLALRGQRLGCFCVDLHFRGECHARIIAEWIESQPTEQRRSANA